MRFRVLYLVGLTGLLLAACGTVAEPRAAFDPTNTALPRAENFVNVADDDGQPDEEAAEAAQIAATSTLLPTLPPTEAPTATSEPTAIPTEEATEAPEPIEEPAEEATEEAAEAEPTEAPAAEGVMVNGILGDPASGEFWFNEFPNPGTGQACVTCHNPDEALTGLGPSLYGIADVAGERIDGLTAEEYLLESISDPRAFLAPSQLNPDGEEVEWNPELMPDDWAQVMDETALADLVAYLLTLHAEE